MAICVCLLMLMAALFGKRVRGGPAITTAPADA